MKKFVLLTALTLLSASGFFILGKTVILKNISTEKPLESPSPIDVTISQIGHTISQIDATIDTEYLREFFGEVREASESSLPAYE